MLAPYVDSFLCIYYNVIYNILWIRNENNKFHVFANRFFFVAIL